MVLRQVRKKTDVIARRNDEAIPFAIVRLFILKEIASFLAMTINR
jgi:hypothetical protein